VTRPLRIVGLMAVLALAGAGCSGSDGAPFEPQAEADAPSTTTTFDPGAPGVADTTPAAADGPTCAVAVEELSTLIGDGRDLRRTFDSADVATLEATTSQASKVLEHAVDQAAAAGQDQAEENLAVLVEMLADVQAGLADGPPSPAAVFAPAYFEHGYAAAALRELAATANLAPCGEVADLVVGADG
jgi:hypothetical protein